MTGNVTWLSPAARGPRPAILGSAAAGMPRGTGGGRQAMRVRVTARVALTSAYRCADADQVPSATWLITVGPIRLTAQRVDQAKAKRC